MAKKLIVGNWKMHLDTHQASLFTKKLAQEVPIHRDVEVVLCPSLLVIQSLSLQIRPVQFKLGAQNAYWRDEGPYTGEISATMLRGVVKYLLVGHSERRHVFGESNKETRAKVQSAIRNNLQPILCVGETAADRAEGDTRHVIHDQVTAGLANVTSEEIPEVVIAYEPVWAIGTGNSASPDDVKKVVKIIRKTVSALFGKEAAEKMRVLYGGSVDATNAAGYLAVEGIDGLLVGGASLKAKTFAELVELAHNSGNTLKQKAHK